MYCDCELNWIEKLNIRFYYWGGHVMWHHNVGKTRATQNSLSMRCLSREPVCGRLDMMLMLSPLSQRSLRLRSGLLTWKKHTVLESVESYDVCHFGWMYLCALPRSDWVSDTGGEICVQCSGYGGRSLRNLRERERDKELWENYTYNHNEWY